MKGRGANTVQEAAELYAKSLISVRNQFAEQYYLSPFGLDLKSFLDRQQELDGDFVADISEKMRTVETGVQTLVAGVDADNTPHIYSIGGHDEFGQEQLVATCLDRRGFAAVGIGARQFETLFMSLGYDTTWKVMEAMLVMYSAKKQAETSPGVGRFTDMFIIDHDGFRLLSEDSGKVLEMYHRQFIASVFFKGRNTTEKMKGDTDRLLQVRNQANISWRQ